MPIARPSAAPGEPVERLSGNEETACCERLGGESEQHQHADRPGLACASWFAREQADGQQMARRDARFEAQELRRAERKRSRQGQQVVQVSAAEQQRFRRQLVNSHSASSIRPVSPRCPSQDASHPPAVEPAAAVEEIVVDMGAGQRPSSAPSALAAQVDVQKAPASAGSSAGFQTEAGAASTAAR